MDPSTAVRASCHCGSCKFDISYRNTSLPRKVHLCHCSICRRTHGTLCTFHDPLPPYVHSPEWIAPSSLGQMTSYDCGATLKYFCSTCGCHMLDWHKTEHDWCLSAAVLDKHEGIYEVSSHVFPRSAGDGGLSVWLPSIDGREMNVWNPSESDDKTSSDAPLQKEERLRVHCHCNGVDFTISRPTSDTTADPGLQQWVRGTNKWKASLCACTSCRLTSGAHVIGWAFVPKSCISISPSSPLPEDLLIGTSKSYKSSEDVTRTFCSRCGASVFYAVADRPLIVDVAAGLLDAEEGVRAEEWVEWETAKVGWNKDGVTYCPRLVGALEEGLKEWGLERDGALVDYGGN